MRYPADNTLSDMELEWDSIFHSVSTGICQDVSSAAEETMDAASQPPMADVVQVPTPPHSQRGTPEDEDEDRGKGTVVSVSSAFFPGADIDSRPADLVVLSSDYVFFYVHTHRLLAASENGFNSYLPRPTDATGSPSPPILPIELGSTELNIMFHAIYDKPVAHYSPPADAVITAVKSLRTFGLSAGTFLAPSTPLFDVVVATASHAPMEFYALAASLNLYHLAVPVSSHLTAYPLSTITDELALQIGPLYLKRLFFMHLGRIDALKRLMSSPPRSHTPTADCDVAEQKKVSRAWSLACAYIAWDAKSGLTSLAIEAALRPLADRIACERCRLHLRQRIVDLMSEWSDIKVGAPSKDA